MSSANQLKLTSHVGRDLLASASSFKTEEAVIWEYVVNSLQYVDEGVLPKVFINVKPRNKHIEIRDNGRGMNESDLQRFFTMHGENIERLHGRPGRGKFGTGKSAAFGIGKSIEVDTTRNGVNNVVVLDREAIEASDGKEVPLNWVVRNEASDEPNGTIIRIQNIFLPKINTAPIIQYIERHLQIFRAQKPEVAVNEHVCEYKEPTINETYEFHPNEKQIPIIGDILLTIKVSSVPLPKVEQGISVTAGLGNLVAIETAGIEAKEQGNYLFGEVDAPNLESFVTPVEPYDPTRSLELNMHHPVARILVPFIASKLEEVRKIQVKKLNEARKGEAARRLSSEADKIAQLLNDDFKSVMGRLSNIRSISSRKGPVDAQFGKSNDAGEDAGAWIEGTSEQGTLPVVSKDNEKDEPDEHESDSTKREDPAIPKSGTPDTDGNKSIDPVSGKGARSKRPRGGFSVDYRNLGQDTDRSKYDEATLTILINLDHPVVKNALRVDGPDDLSFRRLSYEIAFTEYAIAFGYEILKQDPDMPADDILFDVKSTLNRVSTSAASLYG